ncbi:hypothetical protein NW757_013310 [Fusarium falciforme]|nr:hypothetical protein NW757_013310 [Fusarium falciforme]
MNFSPSWLKVEEGLGGIRPVLRGDAEEMTSQFAGLQALLAPTDPQPYNSVSTKDNTYEGTKYRIYTPHRETNAQDRLPIGVFFHGGGFVLGDLETEDGLCRAIAQNANTLIISVNYRKAPAHKSPAQLQDALKMFQWAYHNATALGGEPNKLYVIGTSAGGALAFAVARKVVLGSAELPKDAVKGIIAFSPVMYHPDNVPERYSSQHTAFKDNEKDTPIIDVASLMSFFKACNAKSDDADYFVGLDQASHGLFPTTYIVTCGLDPLRDDGKIVAGSMKNQGVHVKSDHYDGLPHCFWMFPTLPETREFLRNAFSGVEWVIENM